MLFRGYLFLCAVCWTTASVIPECVRVQSGWERTVSSIGGKCLNWLTVPAGYNITRNNTGLWDHGFCRRVDSSERPWCFVLAADGTQRQDCTPCQDQAVTAAPPPPSDDGGGGGGGGAGGGGAGGGGGGGGADSSSATAGGGGGGGGAGGGGGGTDSSSATAGGDGGDGAGGGDGGGTGTSADVDPAGLPPQTGGVAAKPEPKPNPGISRRVRVGPKKKKDLGALGYVLGGIMMLIIIMLGTGIVFGYFYKKGQKLKQHAEQRAYEQEMHRINLPLSAFSNPICQLDDEPSATHTHQAALLEQEEETQERVEEEEDRGGRGGGGGGRTVVEEVKIRLQEAVLTLQEDEEEEEEERGGGGGGADLRLKQASTDASGA